MANAVIVVLRIVIALALAGSLFVQTVIVPLAWVDLAGAPMGARIALVVIAVLGVATMQLCGISVWMLLTKVRRGSVFSTSSFRWVDIIIGAVLAAAVLTFAVAVVLAPSDIAPGVVGLICGAALVLGGIALVVVVMKALLRQAIDRETEARTLRDELDEVI